MFESINKFLRKIFKAESHKENSSGKESRNFQKKRKKIQKKQQKKDYI